MHSCMLAWDDLRYVLAIERARTLSAAARALGVNQSTVTRRLAALHDRLGDRVLERRGGAYVLTDFGDSLRPHLAAMEEQALAVDRAAHGAAAGPSGPVRLTTVETLASFFLAARLAPFLAAHPAIDLELDVSRRSADLGRREADLALRLVRPRQGGLIMRKVGTLGIARYVSASYARGRRDHPRIVTGDEVDDATPEARLLSALPGARIALRTPSWITQTAACEAGLGVAALPCFLAAQRPGLRRLDRELVHRELWLIVHKDLQQVARVRAVADAVAALLARHKKLLAG
jgi:DNA-binding transcriptional LysR family regulator